MIQTFIFRSIGAILTATLIGLMPALTWAGPGAHGPNGEHLDSPKTDNPMQAGFRFEANSEILELVGTFADGELSIFIDRFATNQPLLQAQVEVESGALKAQAKFRAEIGDYKIEDSAMLQKFSTPGEHPLVITVIAGNDSDLLDTVLRVPASLAEDEHHFHWKWWGLGAFAALVMLGIAVARQRQRRSSLGGPL
jgi:hypothetical protein